jgi:hypothetical protein
MRCKIINLASLLRWSGMAVIGAGLFMTLTTSGWGQTTVVVGSSATATATVTGPLGLIFLGSQDQSDPSGFYGHCGDATSGAGQKVGALGTLAPNLDKIAAIRILDCHPFDGPGGSSMVPCPPGTKPVPTYCWLVQNDGAGNHVLVGVFIDTSLPCKLTGQSSGPPAQITISITDSAWGISGIHIGGLNNATAQLFAGAGNRVIVLTATKINQGAPASVSGIFVGNLRPGSTGTTCTTFNF